MDKEFQLMGKSQSINDKEYQLMVKSINGKSVY